MSTLKTSLIGASIAVVLVAVLVVLAVLRVPPFAEPTSGGGRGPVLVALVLPGVDGVIAPHLIDEYIPTASGWNVRSVSPSTTVVIAGTGGSTLADAYSFGGGDGLASALGSLENRTPDGWVIVDASAWRVLTGAKPMALTLPADIEAFDGARLYSFSAGPTSVPSDQVALLLQGAAFLNAAQGRMVREQVGDMLASTLASATAGERDSARSGMTATDLQAWALHLRGIVRVSGS